MKKTPAEYIAEQERSQDLHHARVLLVEGMQAISRAFDLLRKHGVINNDDDVWLGENFEQNIHEIKRRSEEQ